MTLLEAVTDYNQLFSYWQDLCNEYSPEAIASDYQYLINAGLTPAGAEDRIREILNESAQSFTSFACPL